MQLIIAAFGDETVAATAFAALKTSAKDAGVVNAALVQRDTDGKLHIKESHEFSAGKGAGWGLVIGGVAGLLTGGAALVLGAAGAAIGALVGKHVDTGISNEQLKHLGKVIEPGTAAVMVIAELAAGAGVEQELQAAGGVIATTELQAKIAEEIRRAQVVEAPATDASAPDIAEGMARQGIDSVVRTGGVQH